MGQPSTPPGHLIAEKYRVLCRLGEGGMGEVLLAVHEPLGAKVAVKVLSAPGRSIADKKRFLLEAQAAAQLKSEFVAHVTDFGALDDGRQFMVMEYLEGEDLSLRLHHRGRLPIAEAVDFVIEACAGLAEAHASGIIHRDIKPSNLFVTKRNDGREAIKVLDFGVSKFQLGEGNEHALTSTGLAVGTPLYMSPEQVKTKKTIDARTDVWSLGVVLYELCRGKTPFYDESLGVTLLNVLEKPFQTLRDSGVELSEELERIVNSCLSKEPEGRPESVVVLAGLLSGFASEEGKRLAARIPAIAERAAQRVLVSLPPRPMAQQVTQRVSPAEHGVGESGAPSRAAETPPPALPTGTVPFVRHRFTVPLLLGLGALLIACVAVWMSRGGGTTSPIVTATSDLGAKPPPKAPPAIASTADEAEAAAPPPSVAATMSSAPQRGPATHPSAKAAAPPPSASSEKRTLY